MDGLETKLDSQLAAIIILLLFLTHTYTKGMSVASIITLYINIESKFN